MTQAVKPLSSPKTRLNTVTTRLKRLKADPKVVKALKGRKVIDVTERMTVIQMDIAVFLTLAPTVKPVDDQRNDQYRLNNDLAKHLDDFELPQAHFAMVYIDGELKMADGNTRKRAWEMRTWATLPSHVWCTVMVADDDVSVKAIYECYDSKAAKKTNRDDLSSYVRRSGLVPESFTSKQMAGSKWYSVFRNMLKVHVGLRNSDERKLAFLRAHHVAMGEMDGHGLDEGTIRGGAFWAGMRLYANVPAAFHSVVSTYIEELKRLETADERLCASSVIQADRAAKDACVRAGVGLSGETPIPVMFPHYLVGFNHYCLQLTRGSRKGDKAFRDFVAKTLYADVIQPDYDAANLALAVALEKKAKKDARKQGKKLGKTVTP